MSLVLRLGKHDGMESRESHGVGIVTEACEADLHKACSVFMGTVFVAHSYGRLRL